MTVGQMREFLKPFSDEDECIIDTKFSLRVELKDGGSVMIEDEA